MGGLFLIVLKTIEKQAWLRAPDPPTGAEKSAESPVFPVKGGAMSPNPEK